MCRQQGTSIAYRTPLRRIDSNGVSGGKQARARCGYAATLGDDELSRFALDRLQEEDINLQWVRRSPESKPIHSLIIVAHKNRTRTVLFDLSGFQDSGTDWPHEEAICAARVVFVDHVVGVSGHSRGEDRPGRADPRCG